jgi:redox-sensitive bicupin YhaK (pirin superfamily)
LDELYILSVRLNRFVDIACADINPCISVLSGSLVVSDGPPQKPFNTLVLSAEKGEDGVWLTSDSEEEETRGVLIAGEPLDQPVVQVRVWCGGC